MLSKKLHGLLSKSVKVDGEDINVFDENALVKSSIDELVWEAVFGSEEDKNGARKLIWEIAHSMGIYSASIQDLYMARGKEEIPLNFSVPAINIRGMAYDTARSVFKAAKVNKVGAFILEIARSEMGYTDQPPSEYAAVVLAAAIKEGWKGPVFIQGDHFQTKVEKPGVPKEGEIDSIKKLIKDAINAGFYNIDIDTSTLVDNSKKTEKEQQESNIENTVELAKYVRDNQPKNIEISIGGEIGHIGGENSTAKDLEAYMQGVLEGLGNMTTLSKISVQTGTSHGGVVLPNGELAEVDVDFSVLSSISKACREKYKMAGAVQHGASTLADEYFKQFPESQAVEVHLATGFQNLIMDHPSFPKELLSSMYEWVDNNKTDEKKSDWTEEQFHYKLRKKAWGQFKKDCWSIDSNARSEIRNSLKKRFEFLFKALNVTNSKEMVGNYIKPQ